jgi:mRNA interferase RelE/StbE
MWQIELNEVAEEDLFRFDKAVRHRILRFFEERVQNHPDPRQLADHLEGQFKGLHRFRIGDYRVVAEIRRNELIILALFMDHRSRVYKRSLPTDFERQGSTND